MKIPRRHFSIWQLVLSHCRAYRGSQRHKPIRRGQSG